MKKSSAENKPTGRLEDVFRQQFEQAEVTPPADLWSRLEHDLDVQDKNTYRKGMLRYRNVAAVALLLLLATATLLTRSLLNNSETNENLAVMPEESNRREQVSQETPLPAQPPAQTGVTETGNPDRYLKQPEPPASQVARQIAPDAGPSGKNNYEKGISEKDPSGVRPPTYGSSAGSKPAAKNFGPISPNVKPQPNRNSIVGAKALAARIAGIKEATSAPDDGSGAATNLAAVAKKMPEQETAAIAVNTGQPEAETGSAPAAITQNQTDPAAPGKAAEPAMVVAVPDTSKQQLLQLAALPETDLPEPDNTKPEVNASKWVLLASVTPQMFKQNILLRPGAGNSITQNAMVSGSGSTFDAAITDYETNTHSAFSYRLQVGAGYRIGPAWILQGGIGFMQNKARSEANYEVREKPSVGSSQQLPAGYPVAVALLFHNFDSLSGNAVAVEPYQVQYRYRYIHIPVQVAYEGSRKKWLYQVGAGLAASWLISYKLGDNQHESQAEATAFTTNSYGSGAVFNTFLPQALASAKIGYQFTPNWQLLAGPSGALGLRPIVSESNGNFRASSSNSSGAMHGQQVEQKNPVNLGFDIGLQYNFLHKNK